MMACILARILAVTPQRCWKVGERRGWVLERIGEGGREEYERRAGSAPEKTVKKETKGMAYPDISGSVHTKEISTCNKKSSEIPLRIKTNNHENSN